MRPNRVKQLLKDGKPAIGSFMNIPSIASAEIMANVGWDWLVVDCGTRRYRSRNHARHVRRHQHHRHGSDVSCP